MFREMRRKKQLLSPEECAGVLLRGTSGVLAVHGEQGYPYAVPLSYIYHDGQIIFHCAKSGHKLDAIAENEKVSFCVIDQDRVVPDKYTTYFRSVVLFGRARVLTDDAEQRGAIEALAAKYAPEQEEGRKREIENAWGKMCLVAVTIDHMTGKEARELVQAKAENPAP